MLVRVCQTLILIIKINLVLWVVRSRYIYRKIMLRVVVLNRLCTTDLQDESFDNSIVVAMAVTVVMGVVAVVVVASEVVVFVVRWSGFRDETHSYNIIILCSLLAWLLDGIIRGKLIRNAGESRYAGK